MACEYESNKEHDNKLLPWSEKYRPGSISNIIYHDKITKTIVKYLDTQKLPHLLFYGPPGTGKTSSILAIAKQYYKEDFYNMVLVLNASEERGIETVRNRIKQFVTTYGFVENETTPLFKLIILDEIDAMTEDAQAILRKVIEKYVSNVRFCFICNYLKKINPAIQSRCVIFRFKPIPDSYMHKFIVDVCTNEKMKIRTGAIKLIIERANGDMRKLLNVLQSIYMYAYSIKNSTDIDVKTYIENVHNNKCEKDDSDEFIIVNENYVSKILSCPTHSNIKKILTFIQENTLDKSYDYVNEIIINEGISLIELINCVYDYFITSITNMDNSVIKYDMLKSVEIIKKMSLINENLSYCNNDNIQIISFLSIFYL